MGDPDEGVQDQAFNVVQNLTESEDGIAILFKEVGKDISSCVTAGLSSGNDNFVLQVFTFFLYDFFLIKMRYTDTLLYSPAC